MGVFPQEGLSSDQDVRRHFEGLNLKNSCSKLEKFGEIDVENIWVHRCRVSQWRTCLVAVGSRDDEDCLFGTQEFKLGGFDCRLSLNKGYVTGILIVDTVADFLPRKGPLCQRRGRSQEPTGETWAKNWDSNSQNAILVESSWQRIKGGFAVEEVVVGKGSRETKAVPLLLHLQIVGEEL